MDAPLARHLACFSRIPPVGASASPVVAIVRDAAKPVVTMTVAAFEAQLEATRDDVRAILEAEHVARKAGGDAAHAEALASAVAAAASRRDADEGAAIAVQIEDAMTDLRDSLARQASRALQALLAEAVAARTVAVVVDTIERVLADPDHPALTVRGPASLLAHIEATLARGGVTFEVADGHEVIVTANGIAIETRLSAALAALVDAEGA